MDKSISFYDAGAEGFYHGLVLGLIALMDNQYKITSNRESGDGRYDISMFPREARYPGIIMELKWQKDMDIESLDVLADEALDQIDDRRYDADMKNDGMKDILKFGIAFSGKKVSVKMNREINRMCKIKVDFCTSVFCMVNYRKTDSYLLLR